MQESSGRLTEGKVTFCSQVAEEHHKGIINANEHGIGETQFGGSEAGKDLRGRKLIPPLG